MRKIKLTTSRGLALLAVATLLSLSACGTGAPLPPTLTPNVDAIYTAAFQTLSAQEATQLASIAPSATPTVGAVPPLLAAPSATAGVPVTGGTVSATGGQQACDSSAYVSDVTIPDGTVLAPGQTFTKTWAIANTGTCAWTTDYQMAFLGGSAMGGATVPLGGTVAPGQQAQISLNLTAPTTPGAYTGSWRLQNSLGHFFGDIVTVVITVSTTPGTGTPGGS